MQAGSRSTGGRPVSMGYWSAVCRMCYAVHISTNQISKRALARVSPRRKKAPGLRFAKLYISGPYAVLSSWSHNLNLITTINERRW